VPVDHLVREVNLPEDARQSHREILVRRLLVLGGDRKTCCNVRADVSVGVDFQPAPTKFAVVANDNQYPFTRDVAVKFIL